MLPLQSALAWEGLISSLAKFGLQGWFVRFANVLSSAGMGGADGTALTLLFQSLVIVSKYLISFSNRLNRVNIQLTKN